MNRIMVSVIVPVYNVEQYLEECVKSILNQTYTNFEIILVDDGSTDQSGKICDELKKNDSRISVIHKENGGLSDARNKGLEIVKGGYVVFLDSDDYWNDNNFLKSAIEIIRKSEPDIIVFGYRKVSDKAQLSVHIPKKANTLKELVLNDGFSICAWDKIIKKETLLANNIQFKLNVYSEDMEWCAKILVAAETCEVLLEAPHSYRQRLGSITKNISKKNINDVIANLSTCLKIQSTLDETKKSIYKYYLSKNLSMLIIDISLLKYSERKEYNSFVKDNVYLLRNSTRNRERYIYLSIKVVGLMLTEIIISMVYKLKKGISW